MSARPVIDSLRFAEQGEGLSGEIPLAAFERLHDVLVCRDGIVRWRLEGGRSTGRLVLRVLIEAELTLRCQRCLGSYVHGLRVRNELPIARNEDELARWEEEDPLLDGLVANRGLDVRELIEDEMILSLPVIPRHPEGTCMPVDGEQ